MKKLRQARLGRRDDPGPAGRWSRDAIGNSAWRIRDWCVDQLRNHDDMVGRCRGPQIDGAARKIRIAEALISRHLEERSPRASPALLVEEDRPRVRSYWKPLPSDRRLVLVLVGHPRNCVARDEIDEL